MKLQPLPRGPTKPIISTLLYNCLAIPTLPGFRFLGVAWKEQSSLATCQGPFLPHPRHTGTPKAEPSSTPPPLMTVNQLRGAVFAAYRDARPCLLLFGSVKRDGWRESSTSLMAFLMNQSFIVCPASINALWISFLSFGSMSMTTRPEEPTAMAGM